MLLICDVVGLENEQLHHIKQVLTNCEMLTPEIPSKSINVYDKLAYTSLCIEQHIIKADQYVIDSKYTSILIIFDNFINDIDMLNSFIHRMRTDELIFPSRDPLYKAGWVIGHPLAVIKLLSSILDLKQYKWPDTVTIGWGNPFKSMNANYTNDLMHWANRIQLKVGALQ